MRADAVRAMLGLADRARVVDLFEHVVRGDVAAALSEFGSQYESGASPTVVLTDLADFTHLVTRLKYIPSAAQDASLSEVERVRGVELSSSVSVSTLSRIWQMLLKGIPETENSARPAGAAEMVVIRLAHAAHLPSPEDAARRLAELTERGQTGMPSPAPTGGNGGGTQASYRTAAVGGQALDRSPQATAPRPTAHLQSVPTLESQPVVLGRVETKPTPVPKVPIKSLEDIAELCTQNRDPKLKALLRSYVRLVSLEPGRLEINLPAEAPKTLAGDLQRRLEEWTEIRWMVILSREAGRPTLAETESSNREARLLDARQDPDVAAILARFPGARITDVRIRSASDEDETLNIPSAAESAEGDILPGDDIEF